jgi:hypothetical protein
MRRNTAIAYCALRNTPYKAVVRGGVAVWEFGRPRD